MTNATNGNANIETNRVCKSTKASAAHEVPMSSRRGVVLDFDASPRSVTPSPPVVCENGLDHGLEPLPLDPTVTYEPHEYEFPRPSQPPKVERHPTEKLYLKHDLMYIRSDAPIERKENGKCK